MSTNTIMKKKDDLKLVQIHWDKEKTKLWWQYHVDQFGREQGEYKNWCEDGKIGSIGNFKDGNWHGKLQSWLSDGRRSYIDTNHHKKREYGTKIKFKYENK